MFRDAEKQFKSSIKQQEMIDSYLWMGKVIKLIFRLFINVCICIFLQFCSEYAELIKFQNLIH